VTGPKGDRGPRGPKGDKGEPASDGSPDTPNQVLAKLSGTYPGPTIANNAVTGAKVQDGSLGLADVTQFVANSGVTFGGSSIAPGQCQAQLVGGANSNLAAGDLVLWRVTSGELPRGIAIQPYMVGKAGDLARILCNVTASTISLTGSVGFTVRRIR
jgi:hypothetical protein